MGPAPEAMALGTLSSVAADPMQELIHYVGDGDLAALVATNHAMREMVLRLRLSDVDELRHLCRRSSEPPVISWLFDPRDSGWWWGSAVLSVAAFRKQLRSGGFTAYMGLNPLFTLRDVRELISHRARVTREYHPCGYGRNLGVYAKAAVPVLQAFQALWDQYHFHVTIVEYPSGLHGPVLVWTRKAFPRAPCMLPPLPPPHRQVFCETRTDRCSVCLESSAAECLRLTPPPGGRRRGRAACGSLCARSSSCPPMLHSPSDSRSMTPPSSAPGTPRAAVWAPPPLAATPRQQQSEGSEMDDDLLSSPRAPRRRGRCDREESDSDWGPAGSPPRRRLPGSAADSDAAEEEDWEDWEDGDEEEEDEEEEEEEVDHGFGGWFSRAESRPRLPGLLAPNLPATPVSGYPSPRSEDIRPTTPPRLHSLPRCPGAPKRPRGPTPSPAPLTTPPMSPVSSRRTVRTRLFRRGAKRCRRRL